MQCGSRRRTSRNALEEEPSAPRYPVSHVLPVETARFHQPPTSNRATGSSKPAGLPMSHAVPVRMVVDDTRPAGASYHVPVTETRAAGGPG